LSAAVENTLERLVGIAWAHDARVDAAQDHGRAQDRLDRAEQRDARARARLLEHHREDMAGERRVVVGLPLWMPAPCRLPVNGIPQNGGERVAARIAQAEEVPDHAGTASTA
jgi:hypothetical protein